MPSDKPMPGNPSTWSDVSAAAQREPVQLPLDHPFVVEAVTGIRRRSLHLAFAISDALGLKLTTDQELELANRIGNHTLAMEWPEAAKFYATALCLPPTETV